MRSLNFQRRREVFSRVRDLRGTLEKRWIFSQLGDLGYSGSPFTWCNRRDGQGRLWDRLDRFVSNVEWRQQFPSFYLYQMTVAYSDHNPIVLSTMKELPYGEKRKLFRFEAIWVEESKCMTIVDTTWNSRPEVNTLDQLMTNIEACSQHLKEWSKLSMGSIRRNLQRAQRALEKRQNLESI